MVHHDEEEAADAQLELQDGMTPPTRKIVRRRFKKSAFSRKMPVRPWLDRVVARFAVSP